VEPYLHYPIHLHDVAIKRDKSDAACTVLSQIEAKMFSQHKSKIRRGTHNNETCVGRGVLGEHVCLEMPALQSYEPIFVDVRTCEIF
jgi:hypothetical protein